LQGKEKFEILELAAQKGGIGGPEGKARASKAASDTEDVDQELFGRLKVLRRTFAQRQNVPPYMVFSDKTLHEMCRHLPKTLAALREISGVGDAKRDKYGFEFVQEIRDYAGG
jgi:ATP-dependent DNA helicase RecQ